MSITQKQYKETAGSANQPLIFTPSPLGVTLMDILDSVYWATQEDVKSAPAESQQQSSFTRTVDLPGYKSNEVEITIEESPPQFIGANQQVLHIKAKNVLRGEKSRSLIVSKDIDVEKITAKLTDGVLTVNIPAVEKAKPQVKKINVT